MLQQEGLPLAFGGLAMISTASFCLASGGRLVTGTICSATGAGLVLAGMLLMWVG